jgi:biotin operon repressor
LIHAYCTYLYNISLQRAKGYGVLRSIPDLIAANDDALTQSELARRLRMTQGAVRTNLKELERIGLLHERDRRYHYTDAILRYWVAYVQHGIEAPEFPGERDLTAIVSELDRKYQQAATGSSTRSATGRRRMKTLPPSTGAATRHSSRPQKTITI